MQQNGLAIQGGGDPLSLVNEFMILRLAVNDNNTSPKSNYRIGVIDNSFCASVDIAEIVAFDSKLSDLSRQKVEGYLARKWGLLDRISQTILSEPSPRSSP